MAVQLHLRWATGKPISLGVELYRQIGKMCGHTGNVLMRKPLKI